MLEVYNRYMLVYKTGDKDHLRKKYRRLIEVSLEKWGIVERIPMSGYEVIILTRKGRRFLRGILDLIKAMKETQGRGDKHMT